MLPIICYNFAQSDFAGKSKDFPLLSPPHKVAESSLWHKIWERQLPLFQQTKQKEVIGYASPQIQTENFYLITCPPAEPGGLRGATH